MRFARAIPVVLALCLVAAVAHAAPAIGANDVPTMFYVAKSDDRNRVDYGVRLDASCRPVGRSPVYAYWRRFEPGQEPLGDLNLLDRRVYGIARQQVRPQGDEGTWIELSLRALPDRRVRALVRREGERCVASVRAEIDGREAVLDHVFVQLGGPARIDHVVIRGEDVEHRQPVSETIRP